MWRSKGTCSEWEFPPLQSGMRSCVSIMRGCWPWDRQPRLVLGPACCVRLLSVNLVWNSPLISVVPANWAEHFSDTSKCQGFCGDYCPHKLGSVSTQNCSFNFSAQIGKISSWLVSGKQRYRFMFISIFCILRWDRKVFFNLMIIRELKEENPNLNLYIRRSSQKHFLTSVRFSKLFLKYH